jgi:hypothetical protein
MGKRRFVGRLTTGEEKLPKSSFRMALMQTMVV